MANKTAVDFQLNFISDGSETLDAPFATSPFVAITNGEPLIGISLASARSHREIDAKTGSVVIVCD